MFDDVLKSAKKAKSSEKPKSKNNEVEKAKSVEPTVPFSSHSASERAVGMNATKIKDPEVLTAKVPKKRNKSGKRTDPTYKQVGAYIKKDTYLQIQRLLLEQPDQDFSDLVQELLSTYLDNQLTD